MAYSVNWLTKIVTIPLADLTFVSGVNYTLDVDVVHDMLRNEEWKFDSGLWAPAIIEYINTQILSGQVYSPIVKMVNGYTWDVAATDIVISLTGSNTNLLDTYIPGNGISVLANNSAGKITAGSGLDAAQDAALTKIEQSIYNKRKWDKTGNTVTIYDTDNTTPLYIFDTDADLSEITPQ